MEVYFLVMDKIKFDFGLQLREIQMVMVESFLLVMDGEIKSMVKKQNVQVSRFDLFSFLFFFHILIRNIELLNLILDFFFSFQNQKVITGNFAIPSDYDSGWITVSSSDSYSRIYNHGFGSLPEKVQVQVQAIDGTNNGFIFEGVGSSQVEKSGDKSYGGAIYAYDTNTITVWPCDRRMITVYDGWGGGVNNQESVTANVRVRAWKKWCAKCYDSGSFQMSSQSTTSTSFTYATIKHNYGNYPSEMSVVTSQVNGVYNFPAIGMAQSDDDRSGRPYGGLVFATDTTSLRFWAPTKHDDYTNGRIINIQNGWPSPHFVETIANVRAIAYKDQKCESNDYFYFILFYFIFIFYFMNIH